MRPRLEALAPRSTAATSRVSTTAISPALLEDVEQTALVCVDDIARIAGDAVWEAALFALYERLRRYAGGASWLVQHTAPGAIVFTPNWDDFPLLFFHDQHNRYVVGLDPSYLAQRDASLYRLYQELGRGEVTPPSRFLPRFDTKVVLSDHSHDRFLAALGAALALVSGLPGWAVTFPGGGRRRRRLCFGRDHASGSSSWGIGRAEKRRRHGFASQRAHRADRATRALSVAIPVLAYIWR